MIRLASAAESLLLPVIIKGFQLPQSWQLTPYASWQLLVFQNQQWRAVTFQLDEIDAQGHVMTDAQQNSGVVHAQDELLLLWNELSEQSWSGFSAEKNKRDWLELVIESPFLGKRYAYIFRQKLPVLAKPSTQDYVQFNADQQQVSSSFLQIDYAAQDYTQVNAIRLRTVKPTGKDVAATAGWGPNILQGVHANFTTGLLYKGLRLQLNDQQHIQAVLQGVRDGPLRVALRLNLSIRYAGMTLYDSSLMIHHYSNAVNLPSRFVGASIKALDRFAWLLKQPEIGLRLTLQDVLGAQVVIADAEQLLTARVDGQVSASEKLLLNASGRWLSVSANGWHALLNNTLPPTHGGLLQQYLQGMVANFWYDEAASTLTVGADVQGVPKHAVRLLALLAQLPPVPGDDLQSWLRHWIALGEAEKLKGINQLHQQVWRAWLKKLKQEGGEVTLDQIAHWLMLDFQLTGFVGYDANALQKLLAAALRQSPDWQQLELLTFLKSLQHLAVDQGFDLQRVQYRPLDNTLWFAPASGLVDSKSLALTALSPQQFAQQVNPQWRVLVRDP